MAEIGRLLLRLLLDLDKRTIAQQFGISHDESQRRYYF